MYVSRGMPVKGDSDVGLYGLQGQFQRDVTDVLEEAEDIHDVLDAVPQATELTTAFKDVQLIQ